MNVYIGIDVGHGIDQTHVVVACLYGYHGPLLVVESYDFAVRQDFATQITKIERIVNQWETPVVLVSVSGPGQPLLESLLDRNNINSRDLRGTHLQREDFVSLRTEWCGRSKHRQEQLRDCLRIISKEIIRTEV